MTEDIWKNAPPDSTHTCDNVFFKYVVEVQHVWNNGEWLALAYPFDKNIMTQRRILNDDAK